MSAETAACPHCDRAPVDVITGSLSTSPDAAYRCHSCGRHFDEPVRRPRRSGKSLTGLAKRLYEADVDEVEHE